MSFKANPRGKKGTKTAGDKGMGTKALCAMQEICIYITIGTKWFLICCVKTKSETGKKRLISSLWSNNAFLSY